MRTGTKAPLAFSWLLIAAYSLPTQADIIALDFEEFGIVNGTEPIQDFYAGGTNDAGFSGPDYGINFSDSARALTSQTTNHPLAIGNFENNPAGNNVLFFPDHDIATMNVPGGFETEFSFYYSSSETAFVNVYSEPHGEGELLQSVELSENWQDDGCDAAAATSYCNFDDVGVELDGTAQSVDFGGTIDRVAYDSITLGTEPTEEPTDVPEPATLKSFAAGLAGLIALVVIGQRRKT
ncbi:hypothetical protein [Halorhodospira halophila]|uniref:PEP-CTERM protein-sorting domain-containing protein n=1 Tax=Halorhodospira halophila (strain DSM 244 / SL1) TaxID=349124 RepID=A1WX99_HALHL|nr:hypothetical protein [Halorhodospira halophila]ABM62311.1 hypothetical protein Hhal_1544 [Halorhodospira halophila SL1]MBK1730089.1 hypothetical protein [Halorhodospira halophila]